MNTHSSLDKFQLRYEEAPNNSLDKFLKAYKEFLKRKKK